MQLFLETGPLAYVQVALMVGGLLWAMVCCALYGLRWKVPPVVAVAPLGAHALAVVVGTMMGTGQVSNAVSGADPAYRATITAAGIAEVLGHAQLAAFAIPTAATLVLAGLLSGVRGRRAWGAPAAAFFLVLLAVVAIGASLTAHADPVFVGARVVLYGIAGLAAAIALSGHHALDSSREGGLVAAVSFASLVAACESMVMGGAWSKLFSALAFVEPGSRAALVEAGAREIRDLATFSWAAVALAAVPAVIALLRPAAELTEEEVLAPGTSPSALRWLGGALALLVPALWVAALLTSDPSGSLTAITTGAAPAAATPR